MQLRRPELSDKTSILDMMAEFETEESPHDGGFWNFRDFDYQFWLDKNKTNEMGLFISPDFVPAIQFVLFDDKGRAIGFLHLRLRLNEKLIVQGGHIGYSIRPSERQKGFAKVMLALGLEEAKRKNIRKILITCRSDNIASRRTILANGALLEDVRGNVERYWIHL